MFERFTDRARRVLVLAQEEARLLTHPYIGTEHILLGLIAEKDGIAAQALEHYGITLEVVRSVVEETIEFQPSAPSGSPPFTPRAKKVLELSLRESMALGHNYIGTEHMLLGLIREGEGVGATAILSLDVDLAELREKVIALIAEGGMKASRGAKHARTHRKMHPVVRVVELALPKKHAIEYSTCHLKTPARMKLFCRYPFLFCNRCGRALGSFDIGRGSSS